jgi:hypothetical protein
MDEDHRRTWRRRPRERGTKEWVNIQIWVQIRKDAKLKIEEKNIYIYIFIRINNKKLTLSFLDEILEMSLRIRLSSLGTQLWHLSTLWFRTKWVTWRNIDCDNKQLLDKVFVSIQNDQGRGKRYQSCLSQIWNRAKFEIFEFEQKILEFDPNLKSTFSKRLFLSMSTE